LPLSGTTAPVHVLISVDLPAPFPDQRMRLALHDVDTDIVECNDTWVLLRYILQLRDMHNYYLLAMLASKLTQWN
jgi:hypothetical protein